MNLLINDEKILNSNMYKKITIETIECDKLKVDVLEGEKEPKMLTESISTPLFTESLSKDTIEKTCLELADYFKRNGKIVGLSYDDQNFYHFYSNNRDFNIEYNEDTFDAVDLLTSKYDDDRLQFLEKVRPITNFIIRPCHLKSSYDIVQVQNGSEVENWVVLNLYQRRDRHLLKTDTYFLSEFFKEIITNKDTDYECIRYILPKELRDKSKDIILLTFDNGIRIALDKSLEKFFIDARKKQLERMIDEEEKQMKLDI